MGSSYIRANGAWITNYGERYCQGETISSAFVESTVNQVVSKRMVKKQHMRWMPKSAHLLLQVRTRVLNDELVGVFQRWYPRFVAPTEATHRPTWPPDLCPLSGIDVLMPAEVLTNVAHRVSPGRVHVTAVLSRAT